MPGVSETIDWVAALVGARRDALDAGRVDETLGVVLKAKEDIEAMRGEPLGELRRPRRVAVTAPRLTCRAFSSNLIVFGRLLRALGLEVHIGRLLDVVEALQHVDLGARDDVYHTCRALLVHRHEDLADLRSRVRRLLARTALDAGRATATGQRPSAVERRAPHGGSETPRQTPDDAGGTPRGIAATWSDAETLATQGFRRVHRRRTGRWRARRSTGSTWTPGERRTRRWVPGRGPRIDLRRALARSLRTGGESSAAAAAAPDAAAADRAALRRQRLDGALLAHAAALRPRADARHAASRRSCSRRG